MLKVTIVLDIYFNYDLYFFSLKFYKSNPSNEKTDVSYKSSDEGIGW